MVLPLEPPIPALTLAHVPALCAAPPHSAVAILLELLPVCVLRVAAQCSGLTVSRQLWQRAMRDAVQKCAQSSGARFRCYLSCTYHMLFWSDKTAIAAGTRLEFEWGASLAGIEPALFRSLVTPRDVFVEVPLRQLVKEPMPRSWTRYGASDGVLDVGEPRLLLRFARDAKADAPPEPQIVLPHNLQIVSERAAASSTASHVPMRSTCESRSRCRAGRRTCVWPTTCRWQRTRSANMRTLCACEGQ